MSVSLVNPSARTRVLAGETPGWIAQHPRRAYILAVILSAPPWADRVEFRLLEAWARVMTIVTGELHVLDHIVPVTHPNVCGLTVPWNLRVVHWRVNGAKGNTWNPDQLELFE